MPPTYVPAPIVKKPVELLVKVGFIPAKWYMFQDGIVRIMDGERIETMNSSFSINSTLPKGDLLPEVPPGARLRQPEYESIDYSVSG